MITMQVGDAVQFVAILFRFRRKIHRLEFKGYGYIAKIITEDLVYIDNGIRIFLVSTKDISKNYGQNYVFKTRY